MVQLFVRGDDGRKATLHVSAEVTLADLREKISRVLVLQREAGEPLLLKAAAGASGDATSTAHLNFTELAGANDALVFGDLGLKERSSVLVEGCAKLGSPKAFDAVTKLNALYAKYDSKKESRHHLNTFLTSLRNVLQRMCLYPNTMKLRQIDPQNAEILEEADTRPLLTDIGFIRKEDRLILPSTVSLHPARSVLSRIFERSPQLITESIGTQVFPKATFGKAKSAGAGGSAQLAETPSAFSSSNSEVEQKAPTEFSLKVRCEDGRVDTFKLSTEATLGDLCDKLEETFVLHTEGAQNRMKLQLVKSSLPGNGEYILLSPVDDWGTSLLDLGFTLPRSLVALLNAAELGTKKAYTASMLAEVVFKSGNKNYGPQFTSMIVLLHRILYNMLRHPLKEKFRRVKESALRRAFKPIDGAMKLIHELGFSVQDGYFVLLSEASLIPPKLVLERLYKHFPDLEHSLSDVDELKEKKKEEPKPAGPKKEYVLGTLKQRKGITEEDEEKKEATRNFMSRPAEPERGVHQEAPSMRRHLVTGVEAVLNNIIPLVLLCFVALYFYGLLVG